MIMARRKKKDIIEESASLDLHGLKHSEVDRVVENHVFLTPCPHIIITGNSTKMLSIAMNVLNRNNFRYEVGDFSNKGYIKVIG